MTALAEKQEVFRDGGDLVKPGFKQTEVGVIPEDWANVELSEISTVTSGKRLPKGKFLTDKETAHPYIRVADMCQGTVITDDIKYVPDDVFPCIKNYRIFSNDLFISVAGTLGIIGKIPEILNGANLTENADRISNLACSQDYLMYVLQGEGIQKTIASIQTIGAQPKLALERIRRFQIPLPPLKEQQAIAIALSDVDALIESLEKLIAKKRMIKKGVLKNLLEPKTNWQDAKLGEIATLKARIGWQGLKTSEYLNDGSYYLITGTEFKTGSIVWDECHFVTQERYQQDKNIQLKSQDVLVTKDGTIGKVAFISELDKPATLNSGVFVIRPIQNSFIPKYFFYLLTSSYFEHFLSQLSAGSTINHLYQQGDRMKSVEKRR